MKEPTLASTVYHRGRRYRAGSTASQIGPAAGEIGEHAWVDGVRPDIAPEGPAGGSRAGSPPIPVPSALPTPTEPEGEPEGDGAPRKAAGRRGGNQG